MAVLQEKSIIEAIETLTNNSQQSELYVEQHFISWPSAIAYVSEWCNLQGFQSRLDRSDRNNNMPAGEYRKLAIVCQHSGKYKKPLAEFKALTGLGLIRQSGPKIRIGPVWVNASTRTEIFGL
ncbi:hypothetical protein RhiirA4_484978, partial [Rhizophagus irregularis]